MTAFLVVFIALTALDMIGRCIAIANGALPERTFTLYLLEALLGVCLLGWAIGLLASGA